MKSMLKVDLTIAELADFYPLDSVETHSTLKILRSQQNSTLELAHSTDFSKVGVTVD